MDDSFFKGIYPTIQTRNLINCEFHELPDKDKVLFIGMIFFCVRII